MRIAVMQPYFFPYLGYFDLIHSIDLFVVYDTVQYIRRGWIHRNRILHQSGQGWQYIVVPTQRIHQQASIHEVHVLDEPAWKPRILGQLTHYRKTAPYAEWTIQFVSDCLKDDETLLSRLNAATLARCSSALGMEFHHCFCSELGIPLDPDRTAEERILDICEHLGATEYINLPGGVSLYHPEVFAAHAINLTFRQLPTFTYPTGRYSFEPNLSIIDLLMWNSPQEIRKYLEQHSCEAKP